MNELLAKLGWAQATFAKQIGASKNTVSAWCARGPDSLAYRLAMKYLELLVKVTEPGERA